MNPSESIRRGLIAAVPVCLVVVAVIMLRADQIEQQSTDAAVGLGGETVEGWIGTWIIVTLAFGVVAATVFDYLSERWEWNGNEFLSFAAALAVSLSALAFLSIYAGEMHPFRIEYAAFNFAYALGFGIAVPVLSREPYFEKVGAKSGQALQ